MPRFFLLSFLAAAAVAFVAVPARAQRVDAYDWTAQPVSNRIVQLADEPDGGCMLVEVCARLPSNDGGAVLQGCVHAQRDLGNGNQTTCLNVLNKAGMFWANNQGVSSADSGVADSGL